VREDEGCERRDVRREKQRFFSAVEKKFSAGFLAKTQIR
jgi:hypothetical protein